jgi:hypothetical protein
VHQVLLQPQGVEVVMAVWVLVAEAVGGDLLELRKPRAVEAEMVLLLSFHGEHFRGKERRFKNENIR